MNPSAVEFNVAGIEFIAAVLAAAAVFFWLPQPVPAGDLGLRQLFVVWLLLPNQASRLVLVDLSGQRLRHGPLLRRRPSAWLLSGYLTLLVAAFLVLKRYAFLDWVLPPCCWDRPSYPGFPSATACWNIVVRITGPELHALPPDPLSGRRRAGTDRAAFALVLPQLPVEPLHHPCRTDPALPGFRRAMADAAAGAGRSARAAAELPAAFAGRVEDRADRAFLLQRLGRACRRWSIGASRGWKFVVEFLVVFYFYPLYLYFNFSGYCDIVIAASRFFGMKLPENFNRPYLARNVIEFWTRWHITLGTWIRDYLFMPMYKPVVERWPRRAPSLAWIFYFLAFVVAGVWHGTTLNFLVYGPGRAWGLGDEDVRELAARRIGRKGLTRIPALAVASARRRSS